jgi:hypothetical protein
MIAGFFPSISLSFFQSRVLSESSEANLLALVWGSMTRLQNRNREGFSAESPRACYKNVQNNRLEKIV